MSVPRPGWLRKRMVWGPALAALVLGSGCGGSDSDADEGQTQNQAGASGKGSSGASGKGGAGTAGAAGTTGGGAGGSKAGAGGSAGQAGAGGSQAGAGQAGAAGSGGDAGSGPAGSAGAGGDGQAGSNGGSTQAGSGGSEQGGSAGSSEGGSAGSEQGGSAQAGSGGSSQAGSGGSAQAGQGGSSQAGQGGSSQAGQGGSAQAGQGGSSQAGSGGSAGSAPGCCASEADCPSPDGQVQSCVEGVCLGPTGKGQCWSDGDCGAGTYCEGEFICPCGALCGPLANAPGKCVPLGKGCCTTDDECVKQGLADCVNNVCKGELKPGQCWDNGGCGPDQLCQGASVCPCNALCDAPDTPGVCVNTGVVCCQSDDECAKADPKQPRCVGGTCQPEPTAGKCWDATDCGGLACQGAQVCPCGADCVPNDVPGTCDKPAVCCTTDDECAKQGLGECVNSVCKPKPAAGTCWDGGDCGASQTCEGEFVCPCNAKCIQADAVGKCVDVGPSCCKADADCGKGAECVQGVCKVTPVTGACWDDGDCGLGLVCEGETVCPCGAACGPLDQPGKCQKVGFGCCKADTDCGKGGACVNNVCKAPVAGGCWSDSQCGLGFTCDGEQVCPCGVDCFFADTPGKCVPTSGNLCCATDDECAKQGLGECVNSVCKPKPAAGTCWDSGDCALGQACEGEFVCPCNAKCIQPDALGKCIIAADTCCKADADCGKGAECVLTGIVATQGVCKVNPSAGTCWDDGDCGALGKCKGAVVCPCGFDCDQPDSPGKCALLP